MPTGTLPSLYADLRARRQRYELLRSQMELERSSFISHWRDLSEHILPRRSRFFTGDVNRGDRRSSKIIDSTATLAQRTLRSGMMAGVTSPARPWFRLTTGDPDLSENGAVKEWLHAVTQRMETVFLRSNLYNSLPTLYGDIGVFGTAAMLVEEDADAVIRTYVFPVGSYMLANSDRFKVEVFIREFQMTVRQLVEKFGGAERGAGIDWSRFSTAVHGLHEAGQMEAWIDVCHAIAPNPEFDPERLEAKYKRFHSCYFERGGSGTRTGNFALDGFEQDRFLSESGYDLFPVLCPRWETAGGDVYGTTCPGMDALGDIRQLQTGERRGAQAIEKMVNPPMVGPSELRTSRASLLPGDITYLNEREGMKGFRPAHEVDPHIQELEGKQAQVRERIRRAFFEDLFLMLAISDRRQITAREIEERHEEKLLALGPVLEQLNQDLLDPLIDLVFDVMLRQGLVPEPPEELQGQRLRVEYISIMAQAQKAAGLAGIERFTGFVSQLAAVDPQVLDKIDRDQIVDEYGLITGVPPRVVVPDDQVADIRAQRQKQQAAQAAIAAASEASKAAKNLSETDLSTDSALSRMVRASEAGQLVA